MKKQIVITILLLFTSLLLKAQYSNPHQARPDSTIKVIPFGDGRHTYNVYTIDGKLQTPEDIKIRLLSYAPSAGEYAKARNNITWSYITTGGFAVSSFAAVLEYVHNNKMAGETTGFVNGQPAFIYQHHSLGGAYVFTGLASALLVTSIINWVSAAKHAHRSIYLYNQQYQ